MLHSISRAVLASGCLLAMQLPFVAQAAQQVGVSAAVSGTVSLIPEGASAGRQATSGAPVHFRDRIVSGDNSGMQVMLIDETTLTLGANAEIEIDEFVYDPATETGSLSASITSGAFRYVSGRIAQKNPEAIVLSTPSGNIGIRGTRVMGVQQPDGGWYFGLLGPGPRNNAGEKPGGFVFDSPQGSVQVNRQGFGFSVAPGQAPGPVAVIPPAIMQQFNAQVNKPGGAPTTAARAVRAVTSAAGASGMAGQTMASAMGEAVVQQIAAKTQLDLTAVTKALSELPTEIDYTPLTYGELRQFTGSASYVDTGVPLVLGAFPSGGTINGEMIKIAELAINNGIKVGSYDYAAAVDFTNRTVAADVTNLNVASLGISNASFSASNNYSVSTATLPVELNTTPQQLGATLYYGDVMTSFLPSKSDHPLMIQGVGIRHVSDINQDLVIGGSFIKAQ